MPDPGASDTGERIALVTRFLALFGVGNIRFVTADREFIGGVWVGWLLAQKVPFRIRIKAGEYLSHEDGREIDIYFPRRDRRLRESHTVAQVGPAFQVILCSDQQHLVDHVVAQ